MSCQYIDDELRHIASILIDTGARLAEIVGLRTDDVFLDGPVPYILIRPNEALGRTLKTAASERCVPLVGAALWGAERAMTGKTAGRWLFPRYAADNDIQADTASASLNKWLRTLLRSASVAPGQPAVPVVKKTCHSFRHSMRDRLRAAGVDEEMKNAIGGWAKSGEGQKYGSGHGLAQLHREMQKALVLPGASASEAAPVAGS
jgi:integrase